MRGGCVFGVDGMHMVNLGFEVYIIVCVYYGQMHCRWLASARYLSFSLAFI